MSQKTLTRADISEQIAVRTGLPRQRANEILEDVLEEMIQGLVKEGNLKLSSFGSFAILSKNNRIGRNPKTGQEVMIMPRKAISFRASHILKERVLKGA
jgi:integration host factor subunit alpha